MSDRHPGAQEGGITCTYTNTIRVAPTQRAQHIAALQVRILQVEIHALTLNPGSGRI